VAGCCEYGDEPSGSGATELVNEGSGTDRRICSVYVKGKGRAGEADDGVIAQVTGY
jgi:hypothetical protein